MATGTASGAAPGTVGGASLSLIHSRLVRLQTNVSDAVDPPGGWTPGIRCVEVDNGTGRWVGIQDYLIPPYTFGWRRILIPQLDRINVSWPASVGPLPSFDRANDVAPIVRIYDDVIGPDDNGTHFAAPMGIGDTPQGKMTYVAAHDLTPDAPLTNISGNLLDPLGIAGPFFLLEASVQLAPGETGDAEVFMSGEIDPVASGFLGQGHVGPGEPYILRPAQAIFINDLFIYALSGFPNLNLIVGYSVLLVGAV